MTLVSGASGTGKSTILDACLAQDITMKWATLDGRLDLRELEHSPRP